MIGVKKRREYEEARRMLGHGYPQAYVARELGLHRNTVMLWARQLGHVAERRVSGAYRRFLRMNLEERDAFLKLLSQRGFL